MLQSFTVAYLISTAVGQHESCKNGPDSGCVAAAVDSSLNQDSVSLLQTSVRVRQDQDPGQEGRGARGAKISALSSQLNKDNLSQRPCFDAAAWFTKWQASPELHWQKYSQGKQDGALVSLFDDANLGTTNKYYVEFGFIEESGGNSVVLEKDFNWSTGLRMDGDPHPATKVSNLFKQWITPETIVDVFDQHAVPSSPDYVSIDIDSCDLWVFLNITKTYSPRVMTVEYNSNYGFEESRTNICRNANGEGYLWYGDRSYGASFAALSTAAKMRQYSPVWIEPGLDVFMVRKDLICPGKEVDVNLFKNYTSIYMHREDAQSLSNWTMLFTADMVTE